MLCPKCGATLELHEGDYVCSDCRRQFSGELIIIKCPVCYNELEDSDDEYYCDTCGKSVSRESAVYRSNELFTSCRFEKSDYDSGESDYGFGESDYDSGESDYGFGESDYGSGESDYGFGESDYDSMIDNGEDICLNCTYWSVSPYGASYGMICRRGYPTSGPEDSCSDFVKSYHFAGYGDNGQYQFNETRRRTANKLNYWRNNR